MISNTPLTLISFTNKPFSYLISGACGVVVGHPLDTIKTWQQASNSSVVSAAKQIYERNNGVSTKLYLPHIPIIFMFGISFGQTDERSGESLSIFS